MTVLLVRPCSGGEEVALIFPNDPTAAVGIIAREIAEGNGEIIWDAMPLSYQGDINLVVHLLSEKVDTEIYNKSFDLIRRVIDVANKQENFILNTKFLDKFSSGNIANLDLAWPSIISLFKCISSSAIANTGGLQSFNGRNFFASTVSNLIGHTKDISVLSGRKNPFEYSSIDLLKNNNNSTILRLTSPDGSAFSMEFINMQGRWMPTYITDNWTNTISRIKRKIEAINPEYINKNKSQLINLLSILERTIKQIEIAETQGQFDRSAQGMIIPLMGVLLILSETKN